MPKFFYDEETLREYASFEEEELDENETLPYDINAEIAKFKREPGGSLSHYTPAQCALVPQNLQVTAQLALQELIELGVTQITVRYDGGGDEGFAYLQEVKTQTGATPIEEIVTTLQSGPLGEIPEAPFFYHPTNETRKITRKQWTEESLELLAYGLAVHLLGEGYGTGEYSLAGIFVADLQANTLTDMPPTE